MARLYLDECLDGDLLIALLRNAGHEVEYPRHAGTSGSDDEQQLQFAARQGLVLVTQNVRDFLDLHDSWQEAGRTHSGLLLVYRSGSPAKDMGAHDIVHAIARLLETGLPIRNELYVLNHWR
jgi:hypothetical protein